MKTTRFVLLFSILLLGSGLALAHGPDRDRGKDRHGSGHRGPDAMEMVGHFHRALRELDLSAEQKEAIRGHFSGMKEANKPVLNELRSSRRALHEALMASDYDAAEVAGIAQAQGEAHAALLRSVASTLHAALAELTPAQRDQLDAMRERHRERMVERLHRMQEHLEERSGG